MDFDGFAMPQTMQFLVIAYDIVSDRRRNRLIKLLKSYGRRANYSVFECLVKKKETARLKSRITEIIDPKKDSVLFYPLCKICKDCKELSGIEQHEAHKNDSLII